jgi:hypothetical protein
MIVDQDWIAHPGLFSAEECDLIITYAMTLPPMPGDMTWKPEMPDQPEVRSSTLRWLYRQDPSTAWAFGRADELLQAAREHFDLRTDPFDAFQFTEYRAARRGHYDWHQDDFGRERDRVLSLCIQLSDPAEYGGGKLELRVPNPPLRPLIAARGAAIAFRSSTWHRVSPTMVGTRYSAVAWELAA